MEVLEPGDYNEKSFLRREMDKDHWTFAQRFADLAKRSIEKAIEGMNREADETREMAIAFFRMLNHRLKLNERDEPPTEEEVKEALEQLKDVGRISIFASASILPGGAVSLVGLELLARKFGIRNFTLVPSSFRKHFKKI